MFHRAPVSLKLLCVFYSTVLPPDVPLVIVSNVQEYFIGSIMIIALSNICMNHNSTRAVHKETKPFFF